jgi:hypothetical protein
MRITLGILALSLCQYAAAQVADRQAQDESAEPLVSSVTDSVTTDSVPLTANTLYMCDFVNNSPLYKINPISGQATKIGSMQLNQTCTDLAFRKTAASGTQLFGTSFTRLFKIVPTTGKATLLPDAYGPGITDINALVAQGGSGILYGAGSTAPGRFISISPTTGKATVKGSFGAGISSAGDLEFLNGQLYALVYKSGHGANTFLARISLSPGTIGHATGLLLIRRSESGKLVALNDVWGLANRSGVLFAVMRTGEVITINPATGIATLKGVDHLAQAGLAVSPN